MARLVWALNKWLSSSTQTCALAATTASASTEWLLANLNAVAAFSAQAKTHLCVRVPSSRHAEFYLQAPSAWRAVLGAYTAPAQIAEALRHLLDATTDLLHAPDSADGGRAFLDVYMCWRALPGCCEGICQLSHQHTPYHNETQTVVLTETGRQFSALQSQFACLYLAMEARMQVLAQGFVAHELPLPGVLIVLTLGYLGPVDA